MTQENLCLNHTNLCHYRHNYAYKDNYLCHFRHKSLMLFLVELASAISIGTLGILEYLGEKYIKEVHIIRGDLESQGRAFKKFLIN